MAIRYAVANGNWSNTATWNGGTLPAVDDDVFANNFTVTIDGTFTVLTIRNTANTTPAITAGGFFTFANGGNLTCTASNGIEVGSLTTTLEMNLPLGNSANFNGNVISITGVNGYKAIELKNTGTLNLNGNYNVTGVGTTGNVRDIIVVSANGTLNIVGDLTSTNTASASTVSTLRISSTSTINITGSIIGSVPNNAVNNTINVLVGTPTINITGDITGGLSSGVSTALYLAAATNLNVIGNVSGYGSAAAIIDATTPSIIDIIGIVYSDDQTSAIRGLINTLIKLRGSVVNTASYLAIYAGRIAIDATPFSWQFKNTLNTNTTILYSVDSSFGIPSEENVRENVIFGIGDLLTGTLAVPTPDNVRKGVPTDDTIGTADLTAEDFLDAIATSTNDIAIRLRNVATVETTGDQIANL